MAQAQVLYSGITELTLMSIAVRFSDDIPETIKFCRKIGIIAKQMKCGKCRRLMKTVHYPRLQDQYIWYCKNCRSLVTIRKGSFFANSKLPMWKIISIVYTWCMTVGSHRSMSYEQISRELVVTPKTLVDWFQFCRDICVIYFQTHSCKIGGPSIVVEVDESVFARRKYHRGRLIRQQWVFGGYDKAEKVGFLVPVENRSAETLLGLIKEWIRPGSIIVSDCWRGYMGLNRHGYDHIRVNHQEHFVDPVTGACTNSVESMWANAKAKLKSMHGTVNEMRGSYLAEFMWSQRFRGIENQLFNFWQQVCSIYTF